MASAELKIEEQLWQTADKLRGSMDASEYKNVVLGLIFLKYVSDSFEEKHAELSQDEYADPEDKDEYLAEFLPDYQILDELMLAGQISIRNPRLQKSVRLLTMP